MSITQSDEGLSLGNAAKSGHKPAANQSTTLSGGNHNDNDLHKQIRQNRKKMPRHP